MPDKDTRRIGNYARSARDFLLDLVFPIECLGCAAPGEWLCARCLRAIPIMDRHACPECGRDSAYSRYCRKCAPGRRLDGIWAGSDYGNKTVAELVKRYKYNFARDLSGVLGRLLCVYFVQLLARSRLDRSGGLPFPLACPGEAAVMSVPLHKKRLRWRGFNQSELIALGLCQRFGLAYRARGLARIRYARPQMKLGKAERLANLSGAFAGEGENLAGQALILVDDVATTGATLEACARVLKDNGASEVWGLVVAKG